MAEAQLELDVSPALASVEEIDAAFSDIVQRLQDGLTNVLTDALTSQIDDIGNQLQDVFATVPTGFVDSMSTQIDDVHGQFDSLFGDITDQISSLNAEPIDLSVDTTGLDTAATETGNLEQSMSSAGEASGGFTGAINLQEAATSALEVATGTLEGSTGGLLRTVVPGVAIFGGITAAVAGLVEKGDQATTSEERLNRTFGDSAPSIFGSKIDGVNFTLGELDTKTGTSGTAMKNLLATFGDTAIGAGATQDEAAKVTTQMGFLANAVTTLNPTLGTADQNFQMISRGLGGSTRILQRYGITIDAAQQSTLALSIAQEHGRDKASLYDKQVAGLQLSMEALQQKAKDSGQSLDEFLNQGLDNSTIKFRALKGEISTTLTQLGVPIVEAGLSITQAFTPAITGVIGLFGGLVDQIVPMLVPIAQSFSTAIAPVIAAIPGFVSSVKPIISDLVGIIGSILVPLGSSVTGFLDLATAVAGVAKPYILDFLGGVKDGLKTIRDVAADTTTWLADHLGPAFNTLKTLAGDLGINLGSGSGGLAGTLGTATVAAGVGVLGYKLFGATLSDIGTLAQGAGSAIELITSPISLTVLAIAALALGAYELYQNWKPFRDLVNTIGDYLANSFIPDVEHLAGSIRDTLKPVVEDIGRAFHAIGDAFDTVANSNVGQSIGALASAIQSVLGPVGDLAVGLLLLSPLLVALGFAIGSPFIATAAIIGGVVAAIAGIGIIVKGVYDDVKPFHDLVQNVWERIQRLGQVIITAAIPAFRQVAGVVASAVEQFDKLWPKIMAVGQVVLEVIGAIVLPILMLLWDFITNEIGPVFDFLERQVKTAFDAVANVVSGTIDIVMGILQIFFSLLTGDWQGAWDGLKQVVEGVWEVIKGVIGFALGTIENVLQLALGTLGAIWHVAWDAMRVVLSAIWDGIKAIVMGAIGIIVGIIQTEIDIIKTIWTTVWNAISAVISTVWDTIKSVVSFSINLVSSIIGGAMDGVFAAWNLVWSGFKSVVSDVWDGLVGIIKGGVNLMIDGINFFIGMLDKIKIHIPEIFGIGGGDFGFSIDKIPHLHEGGVVPGPTGKEILTVLQAGEEVKSIANVERDKQAPQRPDIKIEFGGIVVQMPEQVDRNTASQIGKDIADAASRDIITAVGTV